MAKTPFSAMTARYNTILEAVYEGRAQDALRLTKEFDWDLNKTQSLGKDRFFNGAGPMEFMQMAMYHDITKSDTIEDWPSHQRQRLDDFKSILSGWMDQGYNPLMDDDLFLFFRDEMAGEYQPRRDDAKTLTPDLWLTPWIMRQCFQRQLTDEMGDDLLGRALNNHYILREVSPHHFFQAGADPNGLVTVIGSNDVAEKWPALGALVFSVQNLLDQKEEISSSDVRRSISTLSSLAIPFLDAGADLFAKCPDGTEVHEAISDFFVRHRGIDQSDAQALKDRIRMALDHRNLNNEVAPDIQRAPSALARKF